MSPLTLAVIVGAMLFLTHLSRGRETMHLRRCVRCNAHPWDRHDKDCRHRDRT